MKSTFTFCTLLALSLAFTSCKGDEKEETEAATTSTTPQQVIVPRVDPIPGQNSVQPQQVTMPPQNAPQAGQAIAPQAGMNPAHGQPGHRCDIAVGAPLNSVAAKAATPGKGGFTTTTIPTSTTTTSAPTILKSDAPVAVAPGTNPPHGQPGHVCGSPVGEALPKTTEAETKTETQQ